MTPFKLLVVACLLAQFSVLAHAQLDAGEITALQAIYAQFANVLSDPDLTGETPWSSATSQACDVDGLPCTLNNMALTGSIPNEITGLTYLTYLDLRTNSITGTIPIGMSTMTNLTTLILRGNAINLCAHEPSIPSSLISCQLQGQSSLTCGYGCCGCNGNWTSITPLCTVDVPDCGGQGCSWPAPVGPAGAVCQGNVWYILSSYSGSLTVQGPVQLMGDLSVSRTDALVYVGLDATMAVTGKATILSQPVLYVTDQEVKDLKSSGIRTSLSYTYYTFLTTGNSQSTRPNRYYVAVHTTRHCLRPFATISGDSLEWTIGVRYRTSCNTWWIILLCVLPAVLGGLLGGLLPLCLS